jgi:hypothetical protein
MRLLADRKEVKARWAILPDKTMLIEWVKKEVNPGHPALERFAKETNHPIIDRTFAWSIKVNKSISEKVFSISLFPLVRESRGTLNECS